jgi:hypothetical protein
MLIDRLPVFRRRSTDAEPDSGMDLAFARMSLRELADLPFPRGADAGVDVPGTGSTG